MFSKAESRALKQLFWTSFGKSFPKKWIKYNTKIKDFSFKFVFDTKKALVVLDIEDHNLEKRDLFYNRILDLKSILKTYLPKVIFDAHYILENGKTICRIYVQKDEVCIHNKNTWQETMLFLKENMEKFEAFFQDCKTIINPDGWYEC